MAYIEIRVSGRPKARGSEADKAQAQAGGLPQQPGGISEKNAFVAGMVDVETKYDVRYKVDERLVSETFDTKREAEARVTEVESAQDRGYSVDPAGGRITVDELAEKRWHRTPAREGALWGGTGRRCVPTSAPPSATDSCARSTRATFNNWSTDGSGSWLRRRLVNLGTLRAAFAYAVSAGLWAFALPRCEPPQGCETPAPCGRSRRRSEAG